MHPISKLFLSLFVVIILVAPRLVLADTLHPNDFLQSVAVNRLRIPELKGIAEIAKRRGHRIWILGGGAASLGFYIKWDLLRKKHQPNIPNRAFNYTLNDLLASNQDIDFITDASPKEAKEIEEEFLSRFPQLRRQRVGVEVWALSKKQGDLSVQEQLYGDQMRGQHTDSMSIGLIELSTPNEKSALVSDLKQFNGQANNSIFFQDILNGEIHFLFSAEHEQTIRAINGVNPPLFAVIRYLIKVGQFHLSWNDKDLEILKTLIRNFVPDLKKDRHQRDRFKLPYLDYWLLKNLVKVYQNSIDLGQTLLLLEKTELKPLISTILQITERDGTWDELRRWREERKPIAEKAIGMGQGPTALELGLKKVVLPHLDPALSERIWRGMADKPSLTTADELAKPCCTPSDFGVVLNLKPLARKGSDFEILDGPADQRNIKILNAAAFSLDIYASAMTAEKFFNLILARNDRKKLPSDSSRSWWDPYGLTGADMFRLRELALASLSPASLIEQRARVEKIVIEALRSPRTQIIITPLLQEYWTFFGSGRLDIVKTYLKEHPEDMRIDYEWARTEPHTDAFVKMEQQRERRLVTELLLANPKSPDDPEVFQMVMREAEKSASKNALAQWLTKAVFTWPHWFANPNGRKTAERFIKENPVFVIGEIDIYFTNHMTHEVTPATEPIILEFIKFFLSVNVEDLKKYPEYFKSDGDTQKYLANKRARLADCLMNPKIASSKLGSQIYFLLVDSPEQATRDYVIHSFAMNGLRQPEWAVHPDADAILNSVLSRSTLWSSDDWSNTLWFVFNYVFSNPEWLKRPNTISALERILNRYQDADPYAFQWITQRMMSDKTILRAIGQNTAVIRQLLKNPDNHWKIARYTLPSAAQNPEAARLVLEMIKVRRSEGDIVWHILSEPEWAHHPESAEIIRELLNAGTVDHLLAQVFQNDPNWANHATLRLVCGGQAPSVPCLRNALNSGSFHPKAQPTRLPGDCEKLLSKI